ncbi:MAG: hypothetical protein IPQ02_14350 [Saprospiraceae bacterium]|nr:hypothetical protein [Candidatus Defluviibacterium haderslevense]
MTSRFDFNKLKSIDPKIKYGFAKELLKIGAESPQQLYTHFDYLLTLLDEKNNILKWTGIDLMGYLSSIDQGNKIDGCIQPLIKLLHGGHLINCNHATFALGLIAQNKPQFKNQIFKELLLVDQDFFDTNECKNIAIGKVLEVLKSLISDIMNNKEAIDFINRATENSRNATKRKAILLLNKIKKIQLETKDKY